MRKLFGNRTTILILGVISVLVIIFLIASLGGLELKPAQPFTVVRESPATSPGEVPGWNGLVYIIVIFFVLMVVLILLLPPDQRKKFLVMLGWLILAGAIISLVVFRINLGRLFQPPPPNPNEQVITLVPAPTHMAAPVVTPSVFTPPQVSSWTSYFIALGILIIVSVFLGWVIWRRRKKGAPLDALADIARSTLDDIDAGRDWGDAILNSYFRMTAVVADWRNIRRGLSMTPAEFAEYLVSTHLPEDSVYRLTALFERVRYGDKRSNDKDIQEAVDCLTAILDYCREAK